LRQLESQISLLPLLYVDSEERKNGTSGICCYVCITIIDTIILNNYPNDAHIYDTP
jgi:hypothetical protein